MGKAWSMCFACWRCNHDQHRDRRRQQCRSGDPENAQCSRLLHLRRCPGTQSDFKKEGAVWREYAPDAVASNYEFEEVRRTRDEILLRDLAPREGVADSASLVDRSAARALDGPGRGLASVTARLTQVQEGSARKCRPIAYDRDQSARRVFSRRKGTRKVTSSTSDWHPAVAITSQQKPESHRDVRARAQRRQFRLRRGRGRCWHRRSAVAAPRGRRRDLDFQAISHAPLQPGQNP
jgi:hypothetical protein